MTSAVVSSKVIVANAIVALVAAVVGTIGATAVAAWAGSSTTGVVVLVTAFVAVAIAPAAVRGGEWGSVGAVSARLLTAASVLVAGAGYVAAVEVGRWAHQPAMGFIASVVAVGAAFVLAIPGGVAATRLSFLAVCGGISVEILRVAWWRAGHAATSDAASVAERTWMLVKVGSSAAVYDGHLAVFACALVAFALLQTRARIRERRGAAGA